MPFLRLYPSKISFPKNGKRRKLSESHIGTKFKLVEFLSRGKIFGKPKWNGYIITNLEVLRNFHSQELIDKEIVKNQVHGILTQLTRKDVAVLTIDEKVVGTGALANFGTQETPKYCISNFFIDPQKHSQGLGKELFLYLKSLSIQKQALTLHVPSSKNAVGFYEKMGFTPDGVQEEPELTWMSQNLPTL